MDGKFAEDIKTLTEICKRYGWSIAVGPEDENGEVIGMILGTDEYIEELLEDEVFDD